MGGEGEGWKGVGKGGGGGGEKGKELEERGPSRGGGRARKWERGGEYIMRGGGCEGVGGGGRWRGRARESAGGVDIGEVGGRGRGGWGNVSGNMNERKAMRIGRARVMRGSGGGRG